MTLSLFVALSSPAHARVTRTDCGFLLALAVAVVLGPHVVTVPRTGAGQTTLYTKHHFDLDTVSLPQDTSYRERPAYVAAYELGAVRAASADLRKFGPGAPETQQTKEQLNEMTEKALALVLGAHPATREKLVTYVVKEVNRDPWGLNDRVMHPEKYSANDVAWARQKMHDDATKEIEMRLSSPAPFLAVPSIAFDPTGPDEKHFLEELTRLFRETGFETHPLVAYDRDQLGQLEAKPILYLPKQHRLVTLSATYPYYRVDDAKSWDGSTYVRSKHPPAGFFRLVLYGATNQMRLNPTFPPDERLPD